MRGFALSPPQALSELASTVNRKHAVKTRRPLTAVVQRSRCSMVSSLFPLSKFFFVRFAIEHIPFGTTLDDGPRIGLQTTTNATVDLFLFFEFGGQNPFDFAQGVSFVACKLSNATAFQTAKNDMREMADLIVAQ
jgi:hypothetical protein